MKTIRTIYGQPPEAGEADATLALVDSDERVVASVSLWWCDTPGMDQLRIGTIGDFFAEDETVANRVLHLAGTKLKEMGCDLAVGPMNGNTWRSHRFVVESGGHGPFLLEPRNPPAYPDWWKSAGFNVLSRYSSSWIALSGKETFPEVVKNRLIQKGVRIRQLDATRYSDELKLIYQVSCKSFTHNFLYTPLAEDAFVDAYLKVRDRVDPDFVRIAERDGIACGFVFGIQDWEAAARGEAPALIVKTLAVNPESQCAGLGNWLVHELHEQGLKRGFKEAIHALQHQKNTSLKITGRHGGDVIRRYALFSKSL